MSKAGGLARIRLHGNPGTAAGRRLGGLNSVKSPNRKSGAGFRLLQTFPIPPNSIKLAELLGVLAGDGHIGVYQVSVTTNAETDIEHARYVKGLFEHVFSIKASLSLRSDCKACVVVVSSKFATDILIKKGMKRGHKIRGGLHMPHWIKSHSSYRKAFVRGLFDTDGSVYLDTHRIKGRTYKNICMLFTNRCLPLLSDFKTTLETLGLHPTQKTDFAVFLRRKEDIRRYFELVGSSNPKHVRKIQAYFSSLC